MYSIQFPSRPLSSRDRLRRRLSARAAYTILELLVVIMIGGVMAQLSIGRIHALMSQQRVLHAATAIENDLEAAFQIAGRNRKPVEIVWTPSVQQFSITDRTGTMYYRKINFSKQAYGFDANSVTVSQSPLEVYPNGLASSDLLITFSSNGVTKKVHMTRAGLVQIQ
jgi:Tfp pilus assembly protein FimT